MKGPLKILYVEDVYADADPKTNLERSIKYIFILPRNNLSINPINMV